MTPAADDPHILRALALLDEHGIEAPSIDTIWVMRFADAGLRGAAGCCELPSGRISINADAQPYRWARTRGDCIALASIIAHEHYHQRCGRSETAAYAHQLAVLRRLGAPAEYLRRIKRIADSEIPDVPRRILRRRWELRLARVARERDAAVAEALALAEQQSGEAL